MRLSAHFSLNEFTASGTADRLGIDNTPTPQIVTNLVRLAQALEVVRAVLGNKPLHIASGYRSPLVNSKVGGSPRSYHMLGLAADFDPPEPWTHDEAQKLLGREPALDYDLILEERAKDGAHWLHLQIPKPGEKGRRLLRDAELDRMGGAITRVSAG